MMVVFIGSIVLVEWESPSVITIMLCKLVLPSIGTVLPVCPWRCLRAHLLLRVWLLTSPSLCPPFMSHLPILLRVRLSLRLCLLTSLTLYPPSTSHLLILLLPLPAPVENDSSLAVTFQILEDCITKGKLKLIDRRGHCYNVKRRRGMPLTANAQSRLR